MKIKRLRPICIVCHKKPGCSRGRKRHGQWFNKCWKCLRPNHKRIRKKYRFTTGLPIDIEQRKKNPCPICGRIMNSPCLDHDHVTMVFRDVICQHCNSMLGFARDCITTLTNAITYLNKHINSQTEQPLTE